MSEKILADRLKDKIEFLRRQNKDLKVVATNGCFDILHVGHVRSLQKAKSLGNFLVVGINSDSSVKKLKGDDRPINNESDRAEVLASLSCVDIVTIFDDKTAENFLSQVKPDIYVKGGEYDLDKLAEAILVRKLGGQAIAIPMVQGSSTTTLIEKIKKI